MSENKPSRYASASMVRKLRNTDWENSGKPYSQQDRHDILEHFVSGASLMESCGKFQRPPSGICDNLRKAGFVSKEAEGHYDYDFYVTVRGQKARDNWAATRAQRDKLTKQSEAITAKENSERIAPVVVSVEHVEDAKLKAVDMPESISSVLAQRQSEGRLFRTGSIKSDCIKPPVFVMHTGTGKMTMFQGGNFELSENGQVYLSGALHHPGVGLQSVESTLESFNQPQNSVEKIMNSSIKIETRVYLNNKLASDYSDNDMLEMLQAQEGKIKFLKELTDAKSERRDELLAQAIKERDSLLALLDTRAKGGKSVLQVGAEIEASKSLGEDTQAADAQ